MTCRFCHSLADIQCNGPAPDVTCLCASVRRAKKNIRSTFSTRRRDVILICTSAEPSLKPTLIDELHDLARDALAQAIPEIAMPCGVRFPLYLFFLAIRFPPSGYVQPKIDKPAESESSSVQILRTHFLRESLLDRIDAERSSGG